MLRVVSNTELAEQEQEAITAADIQRQALNFDSSLAEEGIAAHVRKEFERYRWERTRLGLNQRYLANLRAYNGKYSREKLADIKSFGGSDVYSRVTTAKCRGATALLRDVYLGGERPWHMKATPEPNVPQDIEAQIEQLVATEAASAAMLGQPVDDMALSQRGASLYKSGSVPRRSRLMRMQNPPQYESKTF